MVQVISAIF